MWILNTICCVILLSEIWQSGKVHAKMFVCKTASDDLSPRSFLLEKRTHWPNAQVPYEMDPRFTEAQVRMILQNMRVFRDVSCVRWVPRQGQSDYVAILHSDETDRCDSGVGRKGGQQTLNLGDDCFDVDDGYQGAILHEMMHSVGFIHEQQRLDRDCYVRVSHAAVVDAPSDYAITPKTDLKFPYDFKSIMHYGTNKFMSSEDPSNSLGNIEGELTALDKMKLNNMYCGGQTYCELRSRLCSAFHLAQHKCRQRL